MATKTYANKSNAKRAAKAAGLDLDTLVFFQETQGACGWYWEQADGDVDALVAAADAHELPAVATAPKAPRYRLHRRKAKAAAPAVAPAAQPVAASEPAPAAPKGTVPRIKSFELVGRSTALSPVAAVRQFLNANGDKLTRKEALYELSKLGINYATARTQYQKWFSGR